MELRTRRLFLRPYRIDDVDALHALFTLAFDRVVAVTDAPNVASARLLERIGMTLERRAMHNGLDTLFFSCSRTDIRSRRSIGPTHGALQ